MSIADFTPADLPLLPALQPADWPPLEQAFIFYLDSPLCRAFILHRDGVAAATGAVILFEQSAWLGHIITNERFRRQGLGLMMVRHLLAQCGNRPTVSLIATDAGRPLYQRAGFTDQVAYRYYLADGDSNEAPLTRSYSRLNANTMKPFISLTGWLPVKTGANCSPVFLMAQKLQCGGTR